MKQQVLSSIVTILLSFLLFQQPILAFNEGDKPGDKVDTNLYKMVVQKYGKPQVHTVDSIIGANQKGIMESENLVIDLRNRNDFEEVSLEAMLYNFSKKGLISNSGIQTGLISTWQRLQKAKGYVSDVKSNLAGMVTGGKAKKKKKKCWVLVVTNQKLYWLITK